MEFKFIKLKEYIDATTTPVEVDVACRLPYKYFDSYDDRETANNLILNENGFEGYNWKYLNNRPSTKGATVWYRCSVINLEFEKRTRKNTIFKY
jgi:hypothetical protein